MMRMLRSRWLWSILGVSEIQQYAACEADLRAEKPRHVAAGSSSFSSHRSADGLQYGRQGGSGDGGYHDAHCPGYEPGLIR